MRATEASVSGFSAASRVAAALALATLAGGTPTAAATQEATDFAALWEGGRSFVQFLEAAERRRDAWHRHYEIGSPTDQAVQRASSLNAPARLLVVAEDWCGDSVNTIPYLARLVERVETLEMRVIDSRVGRDLMRAHRTPDGRAATPTVILLDAQMQEVGAFVERPTVLQDWFLANEEELPRDELYDRKYDWYDEDRGEETVREITAILERALQSGSRRRP